MVENSKAFDDVGSEEFSQEGGEEIPNSSGTPATVPHNHSSVPLGTAIGATVGSVTAPLAATAAVNAAGFTAGGITAGSTAAGMMAAEAVAAGGGVAAGGTVATLQSIGAVGFGAGAISGLVLGGAVVLGVAGFGVARVMDKAFLNPFPNHECRESNVVQGLKKRRWMVVTGEGIGKVQFYSFDDESAARRFFDHAPSCLSRILYNPEGVEVKHAGWNVWAHKTIRAEVQNRRKQLETPP